jgi:hypothetical protein
MKTGNIVLIALGGVVVYLWAKNRKKTKNAVVVKKSYERDRLGGPNVRPMTPEEERRMMLLIADLARPTLQRAN